MEEEMEGREDEWVLLALEYDDVVAEMLMRLRVPHEEPPTSSQAAAAAAALPVRWGVVRKRGRPFGRFDGWCLRDEARKAEVDAKGKAASPSTPLSWSGGGGSAGSGDGSDSSSHRRVKAAAVVPTSASTSAAATDGGGVAGCAVRTKAAAREANALRLSTKRPAKKKTIAVLKDEENKLLIERMNLENDIERLSKTFVDLVEQNKRLKGIELPPQNTSNAKPGISVSDASDRATHEAILPSEACEHFPVASQSTLPAKPGIVTSGTVNQEALDAVLLANAAEHFSRSLPSNDHQSNAAAETCSTSSRPVCGEAIFIPDLNIPLEVGSGSDTA